MKCSTIYRRIKAGEFPQPRKLAVNIAAWPESSINEWIVRPIGS
jgi:predicted DNA-binding transcriptional regulator AlpA